MKNLERFLNIEGGFIFRGSEDLGPIKSILCSTGLLRVKSLESIELATNKENIGRHTWAVVLKFFVERTDFTKSLMSTKKQLNIIVNKKQRN